MGVSNASSKKNQLRGITAAALLIAVLIAHPPCAWGQGQDQGDVDLVARALDDTTFIWRSSESRGVRIYYHAGSFAERHRAMLLRSSAAAVRECLECLEEPEYDRLLNVFYLDSRDQMNRIAGRPVTGFANWGASGVFVVFSPEWRSFEKHEITHVLTMELWGSPHSSSRWMIEGVAIHCDGWCREYSVDEVAAHLAFRGGLPPLEKLLKNFSSLGEIKGGFYAGSVIGFIRRAYGAEALRMLWRDGFESSGDSLDIRLDEVERAWKSHLERNVGVDTEVDMEAIKELGCG